MSWNTQRPATPASVLLRLDDSRTPLATGFYDGRCWRYADASRIKAAVLGWMSLESAAADLDARQRPAAADLAPPSRSRDDLADPRRDFRATLADVPRYPRNR